MLSPLGYTILSAYLSVQPQALKLQDTVLKNRETKHFISLLFNDEVLLLQCYSAEVESLRTSLVSRTHFEVLGLEASSPRKMPVLGSRTAVFFELLKFCSSPEKKFEDLCFWRSPKFGLFNLRENRSKSGIRSFDVVSSL